MKFYPIQFIEIIISVVYTVDVRNIIFAITNVRVVKIFRAIIEHLRISQSSDSTYQLLN